MQINAWHFLPENGHTRYNDLPVTPGEPMRHEGPITLCESGLHASIKLDDALSYAPGPILCRVLCEGQVVEGHDKIVCTQRTVLWMFDASRVLRLWGCWCIRNTKLADGRTVWDLLTDQRSRNAVEMAERFARGEATSDELAAAWGAASAASAAWGAASAANAAWGAASAARAAWAAASAARAAASAARAAASAAWDAARAAATTKLEEMVIKEARRLGVWVEEGVV